MESRKRHIEIDFMYLDVSVCTRCQGTDASLEEAVSAVARVLELAGIDVLVRKTHIQSEHQAQEMGFVSSPTILINGRDIQESPKESLCESCTDLVGGEPCNCRVWVYEGSEYNAPPTALIVDAILREVYGGGRIECCPQESLDIPDNIKRFLTARKKVE